MNSSLATLAIFLVAAMFLSQAQALFSPRLCCFEFVSVPIPKNLLKSFSSTHVSCPIVGVIFTTNMNERICANPYDDWVMDYVKYLVHN